MATIPKRVSERLAKQTRRFQKILKPARDRDINEADTVVIVHDMLADLFGFDKFTEITSEYAIKGTFCDLAIKIDGNVKFLIEVKAIGLNLKDAYIRQAVGYGAQKGIQWVILTNGVDWDIYRIEFKKPLAHELLIKLNFLELNSRKKDDLERLYLLCREGLSKAVIEGYAERVKIVNKFVFSAILQAKDSLILIRRKLRKISPGIKVELDEIESILVSDVLKREVIEGDDVKEAKTRVKKAASRKIVRKRHSPKHKTEPKPEPEPVHEPEITDENKDETGWRGTTH